MKRAPENLAGLIEPVVAGMGYELVGIEYLRQPNNNLLRVYIDREEGITLDDCQAVSHQISGVLDVEDPIPGRYSLEISSPGLDRPLFNEEQFERFAGKQVRIRLAAPVDGRRNYTGLLQGVREGDVIVVVDGSEFCLPLGSIEQARLVPEY